MIVRQLFSEGIPGAIALQRLCFPDPFPAEFLWLPEHLAAHLQIFPRGQLVAVEDGQVIGSASTCIISESNWQAHESWTNTVGGPFVVNHDPHGSTLYGLDISVHPGFRRRGIGRAFYHARFKLVEALNLDRFGTACRLPGFMTWSQRTGRTDVEEYALQVSSGAENDPTLTSLLRYGLTFLGVIHDYMDDEESANAAALLEWKP